MATAYWYMGNADKAIAEFNKALTYEPNKPNTLFNLGLVKWQREEGQCGRDGGLGKAAGEPTRTTKEKDKVKQMIAEAKRQGEVKPQG